ncbi:hypothetical protein Indivirus_2_67 [Indivirus ILV1]|uniref:Uncharacterized protein n=1 Tax=Indivirus ILV1 TaxID=1977633 RepID=A0A1V0SDG0_9VIRU|nr:hypothetical protein Indivirus_2_67 [Indivirus ILV1]
MDNLIKLIITNRFRTICDVIKSGKIEKEDYEKIYDYFLYFYIKKMVADETMYFLTYMLFQHHKILKINKFDNYEILMSWHIFRNQMRNRTYNLLKLYMDIQITSKRLKTSVNLLKNNSKNFNKLLDKCNKTKIIKNIVYDTMIEYPLYFNDKITQNNIMMASINEKNLWVHELEIEKRLLLIIKYYGINLLQLLGVNIIDGKYFTLLSFDEKISYYKNCLSIICKTGKMICDLADFKDKLKKKRYQNKYIYKTIYDKKSEK